MWPTTLSNIFILPFLLLISIPLALSASITATLALTTLFIRALVVYFELVIALLANFFLFPAHSPASGSFLALTEVNTPGVERTAHYIRTAKHGHQQTGLVKSRRGSLSAKEGVAEDYFFHHNYPQHGHVPIHSSHEALSSFISGNAERDFEGVGGWRTPLPRKKHRQTSSASSMSYNNSSEEELLFDNDDDDDEAWLSINKRLELPSRRLHVASPMLSPKLVTTTAMEDQTRHHHHQPQPVQQQKPQRPKFHRRSKTSPLLSTQNSPSTTIASQQPTQPAQQLQTSKSSAGLDSLPYSRPSSSSLTPSSSSGWHDIGGPLLMTSPISGLGADYKMVHYYHHHLPSAGRRARRRSSGGSSTAAASAKPMSLTGLGLT